MKSQPQFGILAQLRSADFKILRGLLRDFDKKCNFSTMARLMGQENINQIPLKRTSTILFKLVTQITPTVFSKSFFNERTSGQLGFFDTSRTQIGRHYIFNASKHIVIKEWKFNWLSRSVLKFKRKLAQKMGNSV